MGFIENFQDAALQRTSNIVNNVERTGANIFTRGPARTPNQTSAVPDFAFSRSNNSFSGTDCTCAIIYKDKIIIVNNLETFSYSLFKEKNPVRTLGRIYPKSFTYGTRSIGGSMVFITFDEHPLYSLFEFQNDNDRVAKTHRFSSPLSDDIPPFDIILFFHNEYGAESIIKLYGVEMFQEGSVFSINDIYSENTMQYIAKDMDPMISSGEEGSWKRLLFQKQLEGKLVDNHFASMLRQRQTIENKIAEIDKDIASLIKGVDENNKYGLIEKNASRKENRQLLRLQAQTLQYTRDGLVNELFKLDESIRRYEKLKMTWDMNAAVGQVNIDTDEFVQRNITEPSYRNVPYKNLGDVPDPNAPLPERFAPRNPRL